LRVLTSRGAEMVGAEELFAAEFADGAVERDRGGTFATEHLEKLRADGFLVAPVPEELGGGGAESVDDVLVAPARSVSTRPWHGSSRCRGR
jgi:alkylation response protein AidB-like acyl-CoA dehydrogenase